MKFVGVPLEKMGLHTGDCVPRFDSSAACKEYAKIADGQTTNSDSAPSGFSEKELEIVFFGTGCSAASSLRNGNPRVSHLSLSYASSLTFILLATY